MAAGFNSDAFGKSIERDCLKSLEVKANSHEKNVHAIEFSVNDRNVQYRL